MSFETDLLAPLYADSIVATDAVLTTTDGDDINLRAIDKTKGVTSGGPVEMQTVQPGATIRMSDLTALDDLSESLPEGELTLNGRTWKIRSYQYVPVPDAEWRAGGEVLLLLTGTGE